jgi:hypothetical protein
MGSQVFAKSFSAVAFDGVAKIGLVVLGLNKPKWQSSNLELHQEILIFLEKL